MPKKVTNFEIRDAENGRVIREGDNAMLKKDGVYYVSNDDGEWKPFYVVDLDSDQPTDATVPGTGASAGGSTAAGSGAATGSGPATITSQADLEAVTQNPGTYTVAPLANGGKYVLSNAIADGVTLVGADPANKPVFDSFQISNKSNVRLECLTFQYKAQPGHSASQPHMLFTDCDGVDVVGCDVLGDKNADGYNWGFGLVAYRCTNFNIESNKFRWFSKCIKPQFNHFTIAKNDIGHFGTDGISCEEIEDGLIDGNYIHDVEGQAPGAHGDFIQFFRGAKRVQVSNNFIDTNKGLYAQGHHNKTATVKEDVVMCDNVMILMHTNGITGGEWTRSKIERVLMARNPNNLAEAHEPAGLGGDSRKGLWNPKIRVAGDIEIIDCVAPQIWKDNAKVQNVDGNQWEDRDAATVRAVARADARWSYFFGG